MKKVVIIDNDKLLDVINYNRYKIYAFENVGFIYKLYQYGKEYCFLGMNNTFYRGAEVGYNPIDVIKYQINFGNHIIYEFDNIDDFLDWCREVLDKRKG